MSWVVNALAGLILTVQAAFGFGGPINVPSASPLAANKIVSPPGNVQISPASTSHASATSSIVSVGPKGSSRASTPAAPHGIASSVISHSPAAAPSSAQASGDCRALIANNYELLFSRTIHPGDTDSATEGEVTLIQTIIASDVKEYPGFAITGVYDTATQQAITNAEKQMSSSAFHLSDPRTKAAVTPDTSGIFGPFAQSILALNCSFLTASVASTTQNFSIPSNLSIHEGAAAVSSDKNYAVTLLKAAKISTSTSVSSYSVNINVTARGKTLSAILTTGTALSLGDFKVTYVGYEDVNNTFVGIFSVTQN